MSKEYNPLDHSVVQAFMGTWQHYECDEFVEALVRQLLKEVARVYGNWKQKSFEERGDWQFLEIPGFEYRRFWGDCDCGFEELEHRWSEQNHHKPDCYYVTTHSLLKINPHSQPEIIYKSQCARYDIPYNDGLGCAIHCTCGHEEKYQEWQQTHGHSEKCSPSLPNLKFGEVTINWYKHIGRGMSSNVDWNGEQWHTWFSEALKAIRLYDVCMQISHQKFRDEDAGRKPFEVHTHVQCKDCKYCMAFGANALIFDRDGSQTVKDEQHT
jgi:hypothetical protein